MNQPARTKKEKSMVQEILEWQADHDRKLREEGQKEGLRAGLALQLEQKFGKLPAPHRTQLDSADFDTLGIWAGRVLSAQSLDEVFGERPSATGRGGRSGRRGR